MKAFLPALLFILGALLVAGCTTSAPLTQNATASAAGTVAVTIHPDITHYTVLMSSAPGIGLSPVLTGPVPLGNLSYAWKADYGRFLSWNAPDYVVRDMGTAVTGNGTKIYWTYLDENASAPRPPVHITLALIDPATGTTFGTGELTIGWDANGTAVIA